MNLSYPPNFLLFLFYYSAIEITADEVADDDADVECQDFCGVIYKIRYGYAHVVEGIGNTVGEAARDE